MDFSYTAYALAAGTGRALGSIVIRNRIILLDDSRQTKRVFNYDYAQGHNDNCHPEVKCIFIRIGMIDTYERKEAVDMCLVKQNLPC